MATQTLSLTATRYKGTSVDTQVAGDYIGNVNNFGSAADHYRVRLAFKPTNTLTKVVLNLEYTNNTNPTNVTYHCGVFSSCPAKTSTDGTAFTWSDRKATITLTQTFTANTQYYIWVWSPSTTQGFVVLSSYGATGTVATYTVSYNANGGTGAPSSQTKTYGTALTLSSTKPTRTGYTFLGWSTSSTATSATYSAGGSYTANASATLYAVWKINTYTVKYDANGGTGAPGDQTKTYGTALTLSPTKPTKASTTATGYKVTFSANGGTTTKASQTATNTTKYTFSKWNTAADGTGTSYSSGGSYTANAAATLYAQYTSTTTKGSVTLPTAAQCSRAGYDLLGFATSSTATTAAYAPGASYTPSATVTLYAVWGSRGLVYIDSGTGFEPYQVWIDNGSSWEQYAPYVDNGTTWEEMS